MTIKNIILEAINENPLALREAVSKILSSRIVEAIDNSRIESMEELDEISTSTLKRYAETGYAQQKAHYKGYGEPGYGESKTKEQHDKIFARSKKLIGAQQEIRDRENPIRSPKVHDFTKEEDDGDVYDATQTNDHIKDGDVLKLSGGRAGVLVKAWPVITHGTSDALHKAKGHITKVDKGRYVKSHVLASTFATAPELK